MSETTYTDTEVQTLIRQRDELRRLSDELVKALEDCRHTLAGLRRDGWPILSDAVSELREASGPAGGLPSDDCGSLASELRQVLVGYPQEAELERDIEAADEVLAKSKEGR